MAAIPTTIYKSVSTWATNMCIKKQMCDVVILFTYDDCRFCKSLMKQMEKENLFGEYLYIVKFDPKNEANKHEIINEFKVSSFPTIWIYNYKTGSREISQNDFLDYLRYLKQLPQVK